MVLYPAVLDHSFVRSEGFFYDNFKCETYWNCYGCRKEGGKCGFAESIPNQKITAFKMERAPVDANDVEEQAEEIIMKADPPLDVYLFMVSFVIVSSCGLFTCSFLKHTQHSDFFIS